MEHIHKDEYQEGNYLLSENLCPPTIQITEILHELIFTNIEYLNWILDGTRSLNLMADIFWLNEDYNTEVGKNVWRRTASSHIENVSDSFFQKYDITPSLLRRDQVAITCIRIDHTKVSHLHRLTKDAAPGEECGERNVPLVLFYPAWSGIMHIVHKLKPCIRDNVNKEKINDLLRPINESKIINVIL